MTNPEPPLPCEPNFGGRLPKASSRVNRPKRFTPWRLSDISGIAERGQLLIISWGEIYGGAVSPFLEGRDPDMTETVRGLLNKAAQSIGAAKVLLADG